MQLLQIETISEERRTTFYLDVFRLPDIAPSNVLQCIIPGDESAVQRWSNGGAPPCQNMMRAWFKAGKRREQLWRSRWSIKRKFCFENTRQGWIGWISGEWKMTRQLVMLWEKTASLVWSKWHLQHSYGHKIVMNINTLPEHQNMPKGRRCPQNRTNIKKFSKRPLIPRSRWHDLIRSDNHQSAVISSDDDQIAPDDDPFF